MRNLIAEGYSRAVQDSYELAYSEHSPSQIASESTPQHLAMCLEYWSHGVSLDAITRVFSLDASELERADITLGACMANIDLINQAQVILDLQQAFAQASLGAHLHEHADIRDTSRAADLVQIRREQLGAS